MKSTGIIRRVDELGRFVIPKEIRTVNGIAEGDPLEIFTESGGRIVLRKYSEGCALCGGPDIQIVGIAEKNICQSCANSIVDAVSAGELAKG